MAIQVAATVDGTSGSCTLSRTFVQRYATGLAGFALLFLVSGDALAAGLDPGTCRDLRGKRDALVSLGVRDDMVRGPQWAADNLQADRIERIKSYVVSVEQVLFRCLPPPRDIADGMELAENMPDPKPRYDRRVFPLPARKPARAAGLRQAID